MQGKVMIPPIVPKTKSPPKKHNGGGYSPARPFNKNIKTTNVV